MRFLGDRALLIGVADPSAGRDLARALETRGAETGRVEIVCGYATVMVSLIEHDVELDAVRAVALRSTRTPRAATSTVARDRAAW